MALNGVFTLPVLLVDDEPQLLHSVSVVLRSAGMTRCSRRTIVEDLTHAGGARRWGRFWT